MPWGIVAPIEYKIMFWAMLAQMTICSLVETTYAQCSKMKYISLRWNKTQIMVLQETFPLAQSTMHIGATQFPPFVQELYGLS